MMKKRRPVGLYLHIPFCLGKCYYCDFCSFPGSDAGLRQRYTAALCRELSGWESALSDAEIDTVYFGGGTPTLLSARDFDDLFNCIHAHFAVAQDAEITVEMNPGTADLPLLSALRSFGANRISMGVQSADDRQLRAIGRLHTCRDAALAFRLCREAGFAALSMDLMYGLPYQTAGSFRQTLAFALQCGPEHLSAYGLKIEPATRFGRMERVPGLPDEDAECDLYALAAETLAGAGYRHYEISNYAKPGFESRHNLRYWRGGEYLGCGVAAYSFLDGVRFGNDRDLDAYLRGEARRAEYRPLTPCDREEEYRMLRLRLAEGISLPEYRRLFGRDLIAGREELVDRLVQQGLAVTDGQRLRLTDAGMYVSNAVILALAPDSDAGN